MDGERRERGRRSAGGGEGEGDGHEKKSGGGQVNRRKGERGMKKAGELGEGGLKDAPRSKRWSFEARRASEESMAHRSYSYCSSWPRTLR